jgi:hypothetical protein
MAHNICPDCGADMTKLEVKMNAHGRPCALCMHRIRDMTPQKFELPDLTWYDTSMTDNAKERAQQRWWDRCVRHIKSKTEHQLIGLGGCVECSHCKHQWWWDEIEKDTRILWPLCTLDDQ